MTENEFLLEDRLQKIRSTIEKYGQENFYLSFSGGKDSTVLSALVDMAIPENTIPRVYANTGIEYVKIVEFVEREREAARVGNGDPEAVKKYQAGVGRRRLPVQEQGAFRIPLPLSKFGDADKREAIPWRKRRA